MQPQVFVADPELTRAGVQVYHKVVRDLISGLKARSMRKSLSHCPFRVGVSGHSSSGKGSGDIDESFLGVQVLKI